ncbi:MAG: S9 family peptidase [Gammaproteobacteria bacterium]|nr:S9 family peptidase [Gammaproteobacteria bacterium]
MKRILSTIILMSGLLLNLSQAKDNQLKPFTADDLINMERVSSPLLSPDGSKLVYVVRKTDLEANKGRTDIWLYDFSSKKTSQITKDPASDHSPKWTNDSQTIYFISSRKDGSQIWKTSVSNPNPIQVTKFDLSVNTFKLSPHNDKIVFSTHVFRDCKNFKCTKDKLEQEENKVASGVVYDKLFVRHWDTWLNGAQSQLFVVDLKENGTARKNVNPVSKAVNGNVPSNPFGGDEEYNFSPNGNAIYFSARIQDAKEPISTNFDIYRVYLNNADKPANLTEDNKAWDTQPVISHNGEMIAYLAMERPGFEADRLQVVLKNIRNGRTKYLTKNWDRSFSSLQFSKDDSALYLTGNHLGTKALWKLDIRSGKYTLINNDGYIGSVTLAADKMVYGKDNLKSPTQLFVSDLDGNNPHQITSNNSDKLKQIAFGDYEQFKFKGWNDETVHGYVVKPANFDASKKYPLAFLIHGGPQGSFGDHFHYRWNPQTYTGQGYVAIMIDFHGSTGYGQDFTDSISQNWGSRPLEDLQKGLAYALEKYPFIDGNNACALGASYGGYMVNWIAGNWPDQFKCLVNHDGVFDNRMMYYATEELWFVEWENGGTYFDKPENHEKYNPVNYVENWKTPMLVVQGELDYRIPVTQSLATFTALQRKGIKSKLLYFPDENHWVLKPNNSLQWHNQVNDWLRQFLQN